MGTRPCLLLAVLLIATASLASTFAHAQKPREPLTEGEVMRLLQGGVAPQRVGKLARESGIGFEMNPAVERDLRSAGADDQLLQTLREQAPGKGPAKPKTETPKTGAPATTGILLITVDAACKLAVDGEDAGELAAGAAKRVNLAFGEHLVRALSTEEPTAAVEWTGRVEKAEQALAHLKLAEKLALAKAAREKAAADAAEKERLKPFSGILGKWNHVREGLKAGDCIYSDEMSYEFRPESMQGDKIEGEAGYRTTRFSPDTSECRDAFLPTQGESTGIRVVLSLDRENGGYASSSTVDGEVFRQFIRLISPTRLEVIAVDESGKPLTSGDGKPMSAIYTKVSP